MKLGQLSKVLLAVLLAAALVVLTSGCEVGQDDEMASPTRTVTASPSPRTTAAPTTVPVGQGRVSTSTAVWAQDSTLHVGSNEVDVSPRNIDSFVVVAGGVFLLDRGELWFTDLRRVRDTGLRGVTRVSTTRDGRAMRVEVTTGSGGVDVHAYDVLSGASIPPGDAKPATAADRLGRPAQVVLRPERSDVSPGVPVPPVPARLGPGRYGVVGGDGEPLDAFDSTTRRRIALQGVVGNGFELVKWLNGATLFGLALDNRRPVAALGCNLSTRDCITFGKVDAGRPLVLESGT
ncbi:MAG: hypothetical protein ACSLEW_08690 [Nocardioides sp.]